MTLFEQLLGRGIRYKSGDGHQRVACPECPAEKERHKPSLALTITNGGAVWFCHRCGFTGAATDGTRHDWLKQYARGERAATRISNVEDLEYAERMAMQRRRWGRAETADPLHPYLVRKGIAPTNWRQIGDTLLVPLFRDGWGVCDVQYIDRDGHKRYAPGISTKGVYYVALWRDDGKVNICEGAATAVAIATRIGQSTVAAMSRTNLLTVGQSLRERHRTREFRVWADNDHHTLGNPGMVDAAYAAMKIEAGLIWPKFGPDSTGTDFLDLWQEQASE